MTRRRLAIADAADSTGSAAITNFIGFLPIGLAGRSSDSETDI